MEICLKKTNKCVHTINRPDDKQNTGNHKDIYALQFCQRCFFSREKAEFLATNRQIFNFFPNLNLSEKKDIFFSKIIPFDTISTANLPTLPILKKKSYFFRKNPNCVRIREFFLTQSQFRSNLLKFGVKKFRNSGISGIFNWQEKVKKFTH